MRITGVGNGARIAAVVGTKCRGTIDGFALLSYPLEVKPNLSMVDGFASLHCRLEATADASHASVPRMLSCIEQYLVFQTLMLHSHGRMLGRLSRPS